jgi:hypothetical protein
MELASSSSCSTAGMAKRWPSRRFRRGGTRRLEPLRFSASLDTRAALAFYVCDAYLSLGRVGRDPA